jgi:hypothetical protein
MRFQVLSREEHSETDADYETAVELVYYHIREATTQVVSEGGLRFAIQETNTSQTTTHLEPCFDEATFQPGDTVHYVPQESPEGPKTNTDVQVFAYQLLPLPPLREEDWGVYEVFKDTLDEQGADGEIPLDQLRRLNRYQNYLDNFDEQLGDAYERGQDLPLNAGLFQAVAATKEGRHGEVKLNAMHTDLILALEYMHSTQREENASSRRHNQIGKAVWEAKQAIGEQVEHARRRFNP